MKVLHADDHWIVRSATRHLVNRLERGSQVIEATDFREALDFASSQPDLDLILFDLVLPGLNRLEDLKELRRSCPRVPVVVISAVEDRSTILRCIEAGVMGYIPKSADGEEIEASLQTILDGGVAFPRRLLELGETSPGGRQFDFSWPGSLTDVRWTLTERQFDVYLCLGEGMTNRQISESLGISEHTIRVHISAIVKRLGMGSRTQVAISAARTMGNT